MNEPNGCAVHFAFSDSQTVEPIHHWGKGYVVRDAATSTGREDIDVNRADLLARAASRRAEGGLMSATEPNGCAVCGKNA